MSVVVLLLLIGAQLSLVMIGGASAILPELHRQVVEVHGWMSDSTFGALFAIGQAAPGPNLLVFTLVGFQVAGLAGALAATLGVLIPSSLLTWFAGGAWHRFRDRPWRQTVQAGLVPVTVGMVAAAAALLSVTTTVSWVAALVTAGAAAATLWTKWHPLLLLAAGALLGMLGLV